MQVNYPGLDDFERLGLDPFEDKPAYVDILDTCPECGSCHVVDFDVTDYDREETITEYQICKDCDWRF